MAITKQAQAISEAADVKTLIKVFGSLNKHIVWKIIGQHSWLLLNGALRALDPHDQTMTDWMQLKCEQWSEKQEKESKHVVTLVQSTFETSKCIACNFIVKEYHQCIKCDYTVCIKCSRINMQQNNAQKTPVKYTLRMFQQKKECAKNDNCKQ